MNAKPAPPGVSPARSRRLVILSALVGVALIALVAAIANTNLERVAVDDFVEYWSAGRLNLTGGNPYSPAQMLATEQSVGWKDANALMMWNPPPTLTLVMPFALLPYLPARLLWLLVCSALVILAGDRLWLLYGGAKEKRVFALFFAIFFMPTLINLQMGQIGAWVLTGVTGFLLFANKGRWLLAGMLFALTTIKPHVAYLVWVALALWWFYQWWLHKLRWNFAVGGIAAVAAAWLIAMLVNPQVTAQYLDTFLNAPPLYWRTMTWGTVLRLNFGLEREGLQLIAPAIGLTWLLYWWWQRRDQWNWKEQTPRLLLVSASTMAFGWFFDLVVLLPAVIQMGVWLSQEQDRALRRTVLAIYVLVQLAALGVNMAGLDSAHFIWFTPTLLLLYLSYAARHSRATAQARQENSASQGALTPGSFDRVAATD